MRRRIGRCALGLAVVAGLGAAGCARPFPPPGGERPDRPPAVIEVTPEPLSVQARVTGPVVFRFDRRISERLAAEPVIVSPATSPVRVQRGRSEIRVSLERGWEPGQIYHVVLVPGVSDLFNNATTQPIELVFSTGPEIPETAVAGLVTDRLTGRPARNALVQAVRQADSLVYLAPADTGGFFSLRHLPQGEYETRAFMDVNRNRRLDATEPVSGTASVQLLSPSDTVPLVLAVLPPDTTPARLTRAEAQDTLRVQLQFDDFIAPDVELGSATVALLALPDSTPGPSGRLMTVAQAAELRAAAQAAAAAAAAAADTTAAAAAAPRAAAAQPDDPLPARELVFIPDGPLLPGVQYVITVAGVTNINGVPGGGGSATFTVPARPTPPSGGAAGAMPADPTGGAEAAGRGAVSGTGGHPRGLTPS
jgi:hypothetical protein